MPPLSAASDLSAFLSCCRAPYRFRSPAVLNTLPSRSTVPLNAKHEKEKGACQAANENEQARLWQSNTPASVWVSLYVSGERDGEICKSSSAICHQARCSA